MTPKQIVLEKWPEAWCYAAWSDWHVIRARQLNPKRGELWNPAYRGRVLGEGRCPSQAWASAAETARRGQ